MNRVSMLSPPGRRAPTGTVRAQAIPATEVLTPDLRQNPHTRTNPTAYRSNGARFTRDSEASRASTAAAPARAAQWIFAVYRTPISATAPKSSAMARVSRNSRSELGMAGAAIDSAARAKAMSVGVGVGQPRGAPPGPRLNAR